MSNEVRHVDGDHVPVRPSEAKRRPALWLTVDGERAREGGGCEEEPHPPAAVDPERRVRLAHEAATRRRLRSVPALAEVRAASVRLGKVLRWPAAAACEPDHAPGLAR